MNISNIKINENTYVVSNEKGEQSVYKTDCNDDNIFKEIIKKEKDIEKLENTIENLQNNIWWLNVYKKIGRTINIIALILIIVGLIGKGMGALFVAAVPLIVMNLCFCGTYIGNKRKTENYQRELDDKENELNDLSQILKELKEKTNLKKITIEEVQTIKPIDRTFEEEKATNLTRKLTK